MNTAELSEVRTDVYEKVSLAHRYLLYAHMMLTAALKLNEELPEDEQDSLDDITDASSYTQDALDMAVGWIDERDSEDEETDDDSDDDADGE